MATFGSIPSNDELNAGDNVGFASNLARTFTAANQAEEDALAGLRHGDELMRADLGDNGVKKFWNGTAWVPVSGQLLQRVDLSAAAGSITLDKIVSGGSELQVRCGLRSDRAAETDGVDFQIDGDTTIGNYHRQNILAVDGAGSFSESSAPVAAFSAADSAPANSFGVWTVHFVGYDETGTIKTATGVGGVLANTGKNLSGTIHMAHEDGPTDAIGTSIVLAPSTGPNFVSGSWAELWVY